MIGSRSWNGWIDNIPLIGCCIEWLNLIFGIKSTKYKDSVIDQTTWCIISWNRNWLIDDTIFVFGGFNSIDKIQSFNTTTNQCNIINSFISTPRSNHSVSLLNGIAFIIGGRESYYSILSSIESFDSTTNKWNINHSSLNQPRCYHTSNVINDGI